MAVQYAGWAAMRKHAGRRKRSRPGQLTAGVPYDRHPLLLLRYPTHMKSPAIAFLLAAGICLGQTAAVTVTSVQNGASFTSQITPGAFVTIKGTGFTAAPLSAGVVP